MTPAVSMTHWLDMARPDDEVIAWRGTHGLTRKALRAQVAMFAVFVGKQPQQRWALCFDDSVDFLAALLATLYAGRTPIIPGNLQLAALREQSSHFDAVLTDRAELRAAFGGPELSVCTVGDELAADTTGLPPIPPQAHIELFTSGSTGAPRRVVKTVAAMDCEAAWLVEQFGALLPGCRVVASVTHQHLYGLTFRIFLPMALGLALDAGLIRYPEQISALGQDCRLAFISSPAFLKRLDEQLPAPAVQWVLSAGGELEPATVRRAAGWLGVAPHEIYGSTETGILAWRSHAQVDSSWRMFSQVQVCAEDDGWRVRSPLVADKGGYLLDDMLEFDADRQFRLLGRRDRIVKIEEKRVSLDEVEARVLALDEVREAAVVYLERGGRQGLGVVLTLTESAARACADAQGAGFQAAWRRQLRQWLESVAVPRHWRVVPSIPCNSMGKRVQAQLQEFFA